MSMTKSELLEKVNDLHSKIVRSSFAENVTESEMLAFIECKKALEKQIPKKPILKSGESLVHINKGDKPHEWNLNKWCSWCCPVCGWFVGERYNRVRNDGSIHPHDQRKSNYCNECGQAIDWSDEE